MFDRLRVLVILSPSYSYFRSFYLVFPVPIFYSSIVLLLLNLFVCPYTFSIDLVDVSYVILEIPILRGQRGPGDTSEDNDVFNMPAYCFHSLCAFRGVVV